MSERVRARERERDFEIPSKIFKQPAQLCLKAENFWTFKSSSHHYLHDHLNLCFSKCRNISFSKFVLFYFQELRRRVPVCLWISPDYCSLTSTAKAESMVWSSCFLKGEVLSWKYASFPSPSPSQQWWPDELIVKPGSRNVYGAVNRAQNQNAAFGFQFWRSESTFWGIVQTELLLWICTWLRVGKFCRRISKSPAPWVLVMQHFDTLLLLSWPKPPGLPVLQWTSLEQKVFF